MLLVTMQKFDIKIKPINYLNRQGNFIFKINNNKTSLSSII